MARKSYLQTKGPDALPVKSKNGLVHHDFKQNLTKNEVRLEFVLVAAHQSK